MTFSDLDRLTYVSDFLGLKLYNLEIWNEYAGQFSEQFLQLELLYDETCSVVSWDPTEADEHLHDKWLQEFCTQVADQEMRKQLEQIIKQQHQEKGMVDRHRVGACLFFAENQERLRREVIGSVRSINIHGLLAVARESEGVKAVQDHVILYGDGLRYITDIVE